MPFAELFSPGYPPATNAGAPGPQSGTHPNPDGGAPANRSAGDAHSIGDAQANLLSLSGALQSLAHLADALRRALVRGKGRDLPVLEAPEW